MVSGTAFLYIAANVENSLFCRESGIIPRREPDLGYMDLQRAVRRGVFT